MGDIIKVGNVSNDKYMDLLLKRDELRKDAFLYEREYVRQFGDMIIKVFEKKLECVRKKKTIEFCQRAINQGLSIDQTELQHYVKKEMEKLDKQLENMVDDNKRSRDSGRISEVDILKIKKIYHKIVKAIHPDINPNVNESEQLQELWSRVVVAYECNDLKDMMELEMLVDIAVKESGIDNLEINIPDIEEKIVEVEKEIEIIKTTDPYMYKFLLDDTEGIEVKNQELKDELQEYEDYSNQLEELLTGFMKNGVTFKWKMN